MKERIKYLDVAKFIGIFCIYLGHFGISAGKGYYFVFSFHVALFFFISGCTENFRKDIPWYKYILKNIKELLIPCYFFALLSLIIQCIYNDTNTIIVENIFKILYGCIRNHYFAGSLWFLSCLFVIKIAFYFIRKLFKFKPLILFICFILFVIAETLISPRPIVHPHMLYNIDSACYYIIFYGLGYCCFDYIQKLFNWNLLYKRIICIGVGIVCMVYSTMLFFGKDLLGYINISKVMSIICSISCPIIIIFLVFLLSKMLENVKLFEEIGKNTLFLCGSEYIIKLLVPICFSIIGLDISLQNPLATYIYSLALLVISNNTLVPIEKKILKRMHILQYD